MIRETRLAKVNHPARWGLWSILTFLLCIQGILTIELTLLWNHVSGLNNLGTVGQLVTFIIGVGGLLKVIWARVRASWRKETEELTSLEILHKSLADAYYTCKEAQSSDSVHAKLGKRVPSLLNV